MEASNLSRRVDHNKSSTSPPSIAITSQRVAKDMSEFEMQLTQLNKKDTKEQKE